MLTVISTPIGNLEDITQRALRALGEADAILCEDTRRSQILLKRYGIEKQLISYHQFKEKRALEGILADLRAGRRLALISDAGTPCINDPGQILVEACWKEGLEMTALPGPCSLIQALVLSGFKLERFQFLGFLPKKAEETLRRALFYPGVSVAFESPERLLKTLGLLAGICPKREIAVAREMTKVYEECRRGTAEEVLAYYEKKEPKGEIALVISEGEPPEEEIEIEALVALIQEELGLSLKEAIRAAARWKDLPKSEVYRKIHIDPLS